MTATTTKTYRFIVIDSTTHECTIDKTADMETCREMWNSLTKFYLPTVYEMSIIDLETDELVHHWKRNGFFI